MIFLEIHIIQAYWPEKDWPKHKVCPVHYENTFVELKNCVFLCLQKCQKGVFEHAGYVILCKSCF